MRIAEDKLGHGKYWMPVASDLQERRYFILGLGCDAALSAFPLPHSLKSE